MHWQAGVSFLLCDRALCYSRDASNYIEGSNTDLYHATTVWNKSLVIEISGSDVKEVHEHVHAVYRITNVMVLPLQIRPIATKTQGDRYYTTVAKGKGRKQVQEIGSPKQVYDLYMAYNASSTSKQPSCRLCGPPRGSRP